MRTSIVLDDELVQQAFALTGIRTTRELVHLALAGGRRPGPLPGAVDVPVLPVYAGVGDATRDSPPLRRRLFRHQARGRKEGVANYDVDVESALRRSLKKDAKGMGYALGVEVGRSMTVRDGVSVTPRGGLLWSKVSLDDFTDSRGDGTRVSVKDADSLVGRVGVMVETATGSEDAPGRVFGSVDVEHEFKDETSVKVLDKLLETTAKSSGVRFGLGGEFTMREDVVLRLRADYTTMGGGTNEYGGGVELNLRF